MKNTGGACAPLLSESEVSIILPCELCSTCNTVIQIETWSKSTSKPQKIQTISITERKPSRVTRNQNLGRHWLVHEECIVRHRTVKK